MEWSVLCGVLDLGVDVHFHTHEEDDSLHVLVEDGQVEEVLALAIHLVGERRGNCMYIHVHVCMCVCVHVYVHTCRPQPAVEQLE